MPKLEVEYRFKEFYDSGEETKTIHIEGGNIPGHVFGEHSEEMMKKFEEQGFLTNEEKSRMNALQDGLIKMGEWVCDFPVSMKYKCKVVEE